MVNFNRGQPCCKEHKCLNWKRPLIFFIWCERFSEHVAALEPSQERDFWLRICLFVYFCKGNIKKNAIVVTQQHVQRHQAAGTSNDSAKTQSWSLAAAVTDRAHLTSIFWMSEGLWQPRLGEKNTRGWGQADIYVYLYHSLLNKNMCELQKFRTAKTFFILQIFCWGPHGDVVVASKKVVV